MSEPNFPNVTPNISVTREDAINLLLASIAMEELSLSHILNAEGEKIQFALGTLDGIGAPVATISDLLNINCSVNQTLNSTIKKEMVLLQKLDSVISLAHPTCPIVPTCPTGTTGMGVTGPTGPTGPTGTCPTCPTGPTGPTGSAQQFIFLGTQGTVNVGDYVGLGFEQNSFVESNPVVIPRNGLLTDLTFHIKNQTTNGTFIARVVVARGCNQSANNPMVTPIVSTITPGNCCAGSMGTFQVLACDLVAVQLIQSPANLNSGIAATISYTPS